MLFFLAAIHRKKALFSGSLVSSDFYFAGFILGYLFVNLRGLVVDTII